MIRRKCNAVCAHQWGAWTLGARWACSTTPQFPPHVRGKRLSELSLPTDVTDAFGHMSNALGKDVDIAAMTAEEIDIHPNLAIVHASCANSIPVVD
jgi:hypothetical protein